MGVFRTLFHMLPMYKWFHFEYKLSPAILGSRKNNHLLRITISRIANGTLTSEQTIAATVPTHPLTNPMDGEMESHAALSLPPTTLCSSVVVVVQLIPTTGWEGDPLFVKQIARSPAIRSGPSLSHSNRNVHMTNSGYKFFHNCCVFVVSLLALPLYDHTQRSHGQKQTFSCSRELWSCSVSL